MTSNILKIHTDGGSRGNPGKGACAFVVHKEGELIYRQGFYLGVVTNNIAEYAGVVKAFEWLVEQKPPVSVSGIDFILDSELIVRQLQGKYKVTNENLKTYFRFVKLMEEKLVNSGIKITYAHVPREENKEADSLVNVVLDEN